MWGIFINKKFHVSILLVFVVLLAALSAVSATNVSDNSDLGVIGDNDNGINSFVTNGSSDVADVSVGGGSDVADVSVDSGSDVAGVHLNEKKVARYGGIVPPIPILPTALLIPNVDCNSGDKINFTMYIVTNNMYPTGTVTFYGEDGYSKVVNIDGDRVVNFYDVPVSDEVGVHSYMIDYSGDHSTLPAQDFIKVTVNPGC